MSIADIAAPSRLRWLALDKLGVLIAIIAVFGAISPFTLVRANRIVPGEPRLVFEALPQVPATALAAILAIGIVIALLRFPTIVKLGVGFAVLGGLLSVIGWSATYLTPPDNSYARVAPAHGFWVLVFAFALLVADALTRLHLRPWPRILVLGGVVIAICVLPWSGAWHDLSILREYANHSDAFWQEARTHLLLAFGSVAIATLVGVPVGVFCYRVKPVRAGMLNVLNIVQTIPSIALFGLLIAPLAWLAANVPAAKAIGVSGIGFAPAMLALFAYSLLPIVSNTVVGLQSVSPAAIDAALGMGMTGSQRLFGIELPLAFPIILTGIRIVLVQNIGLATIAALIGGGGFGVFVFQGIGQTAMDLVLLGAVPTVALAFIAAIVLDAAVEMTSVGGGPQT